MHFQANGGKRGVGIMREGTGEERKNSCSPAPPLMHVLHFALASHFLRACIRSPEIAKRAIIFKPQFMSFFLFSQSKKDLVNFPRMPALIHTKLWTLWSMLWLLSDLILVTLWVWMQKYQSLFPSCPLSLVTAFSEDAGDMPWLPRSICFYEISVRCVLNICRLLSKSWRLRTWSYTAALIVFTCITAYPNTAVKRLRMC